MSLRTLPALLLASLSVLLLGACAETGQPTLIASAEAATATTSQPAPATTPTYTGLPALLVHKQESCGCCGAWVDHMRAAGFTVEVRNVEDMQPVKSRLGVPHDLASCHTGEIAGYFVEGHIPADDIKRLLAERPDAKGLALPGMPIGSPGMEHPEGLKQPYTVALIGHDGQPRPYSQHNQP